MLDMGNIDGFILNIPNDYKIGFLHLPVQRKHWVAIRQIEQVYYNLDSKLDSPQVIGDMSDLRNYLREQLDSKDKELLLVVSQEVGCAGTWLLDTLTDCQRATRHLKPTSNSHDTLNVTNAPSQNGNLTS